MGEAATARTTIARGATRMQTRQMYRTASAQPRQLLGI